MHTGIGIHCTVECQLPVSELWLFECGTEKVHIIKFMKCIYVVMCIDALMITRLCMRVMFQGQGCFFVNEIVWFKAMK